MTQNTNGAGHKKMWAYGYQITPPQSEERLAAIQALLDHEHTEAKSRARTWEGRFVHEEAVTHILVVSDDPDQHQAVNQKLEAALTAIEAGYSITAALAVADDGPRAVADRPSAKLQ